MKRNLIFALALLVAGIAGAQVGTSFLSGNIAYTITSDSTVEVGQKGCVAGTSEYSGSVNIPSSVSYQGRTYTVTALGRKAFFNCQLSGVTIPGTVEVIRRNCFWGTRGFTTLTLPASVREVEDYALGGVNFTSLNVAADNPWFTTVEGALYSKDTATLVSMPWGKTGSCTLPAQVRTIRRLALNNCHLSTVVLPEGLQTIEDYAFAFSKQLNHLVIPASVRRLGINLFANCTALTDLTLAEGNTRYVLDGQMIYNASRDSLLSAHRTSASVALPATLRYLSGFMYNKTLQQIDLPEGLEEIGTEAFCCCAFNGIALPESVRTLGSCAFADNVRLTSVRLPNGLRVIPEGAFSGCSSLEEIAWGNAVERIEEEAFLQCRFGQQQTLPATLRHVGDEAFAALNSPLRRVVFTSTLDSLGGWAFSGHHLTSLRLRNLPETNEYGALTNCTLDSLIIPCGMRAQFEAHPYWGQFASKLYEDCNGIDELEESHLEVRTEGRAILVSHTEGQPVMLYDLAGRLLQSRQGDGSLSVSSPGLYLLRTPSQTRKVIVR